ncbi:MAG: hypothetical protein JKY37_27240, partial [Nannocystaceae bacterium]|nr:hypothetical protein [Nannocystaceae bacterium]
MSAKVVCVCAGSDAARRRGWLLAGAMLVWVSAGCGDDAPLLEGDGTSTSATAGDAAGSAGAPSTSGSPAGDTTGTEATTLADGTTTATSAADADSDEEDSAASSSSGDEGPVGAVAECFEGVFVNAVSGLGPDYDQFGAVPGQHCKGTDHQDIAGVQRAVFLGDSVTVGAPPWAGSQYYRSLVADALEAQFGLQFGSGFLQDEATWKGTNVFEGQAGVVHSGDFSACAAWGARTDDLTPTQIPQCFSGDDFEATTLVVMTMGGNDIANLT